jgi:hypothetical protein
MGTPNSELEFLLGRKKISFSSLTASEWFQALDHVLWLYNPYFKYLPGFETVEKTMNRSSSSFSRKAEDYSKIFFKGKISLDTRCALLFAHGQGLYRPPDKDFLKVENYLITQEGSLIKWFFAYRTERIENPFKKYDFEIRETNEKSVFSFLSVPKIVDIQKENSSFIFQVIQGIHNLGERGEKEKAERLESIRGALKKSGEIMFRIKHV